MPPSYDCVILSGGGAKGSFGAGAAYAIEKYRSLKNRNVESCFVGTSAGALNAAVLACGGGAADLVSFWREISNRKVLGFFARWLRSRVACGALFRAVTLNRRPFSIYGNSRLRKLIREKIAFDRLKHPLVVASTNYANGSLRAFYWSPVLDDIVQKEIESFSGTDRPRRLRHWTKISCQSQLEDTLLASAAIPVFFPPIRLSVTGRSDDVTVPVVDWYVDGGVGNHTPTPDAAIMLKELRRQEIGEVGEVFCIKQDPPTLATPEQLKLNALGILKRTLDVYHFIHTEYVVRGWGRINMEVKRHNQRFEQFRSFVNQSVSDTELKTAIIAEAERLLGSPDAKSERFDVRMIAIEPSQTLGDSLDFDPATMRANMQHGFTAALKAMLDHGKLVEHEFETLRTQTPIAPMIR